MKKYNKILILIILFQFIFVSTVEVKAAYTSNGEYEYLVQDAIDRFPNEARDYNLFLADYDSFGDYLNYGTNKDLFFNSSNIIFDNEGLPKVLYGDNYYYNPVTLAQYGLSLYGEFLKGKNTKDELIKAADTLISLQGSNGAFLYNFPWKYYLNDKPYKPGWVSGMAQGQGLSLLSRVYKLTGDVKYIEAGKKALKFLITPVSKGGVMENLSYLDSSLKDYIIFEEYISETPAYTLNGFMFTLLGLYDWSNIDIDDSSKYISKNYFNKGIETLKVILPYYDLGGFTAYDLSYIVNKDEKPHIGVNYHGVHIYLLRALYSITGDKSLYNYYRLWKSYVDTAPVTRLSGRDRYATSVAISRNEIEGNSEYVLVVNGEIFADALCAAPLASKYNAPILLTSSKALSEETKDEIRRLNPSNVIIIGKEGAVSKDIENEIKSIDNNITIDRIGGKDRYETSALIAGNLDSKEIMLTSGGNYADALSIASIAASKKVPVLLTEKDTIPDPINNYIKSKEIIDKAYIIGGTSVISNKVENNFNNAERLGGKDRYETNTKVLERFINDLDLTKAYVAIGGPGAKDFADGLSVAPLAAKTKSPVLLIPMNTGVLNNTRDFAYSNFKDSTQIIAIGGEKIIPNSKVNLLTPELDKYGD
ncbi:N-acetylmuramoyl-L-alanine amidase LytC precursor [Clostridium liquoris]|jgi:putative cell wall-binding protein|uniref:N-acetylmuramoyl-L-alanine amidase LytC n=1 Tax=Clostridium liquoris TaxID=1289519 RepID=A0A2T0B0R7_9CLOT|nr:cell wall-binding repeat-containing protein [Clostridium liquoris]PRR77170.1 N-acetylmuramoyl-L-alanine amidase LytC precursor [Clostridium liquoris]